LCARVELFRRAHTWWFGEEIITWHLSCVWGGGGGFKGPSCLLSLPFGWYCTARVASDGTLPSKNTKVLQAWSICYCFMVIASLD
jgi:hypothetical protein